jgi:hypothetical protein
MRKDMKDVIIDTGRTGKYDSARKTQPTYDEAKLEKLPEREGMRRRYDYWGPILGDRLGPLERFLRSRLGKQWDKVYSEICSEADLRNLRGKHLREHVEWEVDTWSERLAKQDMRWPRTSRFYVDKGGFLREDKSYRRWRHRPQYDPDNCRIGDKRYTRVNNCWFEAQFEPVEKVRERWNWASLTKDKEYYMDEVCVSKRQLGKKELKKLGLSNDPDFLWWAA